MNMPAPLHGYVSINVAGILREFVQAQDLGRIVGNDSAIVTERGPDTVRGADVAFYSFQRLPKGPFPKGYLGVVPELVFEVLSPSDRWREVLAKVAEYLNAGVLMVGVLDPDPKSLHLFFPDQPAKVLDADQELVLPSILPGFQIQVGKFFE